MSQFLDLVARARRYVEKRQSEDPDDLPKLIVDFEHALGHGSDGTVWSTNRNSAVKAIIHQKQYLREKGCYQRLTEKGITSVDGLSIPGLVDYDDELMIVEMDIVEAPYLLDFGKAYIDEAPPYSAEQIAEYYRLLGRHFRKADIPRVKRICRILSGLGIEYLDARPSNIRLHTDAEERLLPDDDWENEATDEE